MDHATLIVGDEKLVGLDDSHLLRKKQEKLVPGSLPLVVEVFLLATEALLLINVRSTAEGEAIESFLVLIDVLDRLAWRIHAHRLAHLVLQNVVDQKIIIV